MTEVLYITLGLVAFIMGVGVGIVMQLIVERALSHDSKKSHDDFR